MPSLAFTPRVFILILTLALLPLGCGRKKTEEQKEKAATPQAAVTSQTTENAVVPFSDMLEKASTDEVYFAGICRLLLTRSVLLALDSSKAPELDKEKNTPKKISIKVLKKTGDTGSGTVLLFSGKQALAQAGEKLNWPKNEKGMYGFAALKGQELFKVLQSNGYHSAILDAADAHALNLGEKDIEALSQGKQPVFPGKK